MTVVALSGPSFSTKILSSARSKVNLAPLAEPPCPSVRTGRPVRERRRVAALARPKHPRAWVALPDLPRNAQGKVVRARVREAILATHRLEDGPRPRLVPQVTR